MATTLKQGSFAVFNWTVTSTEGGWLLSDYTPSVIVEDSKGRQVTAAYISTVGDVVSFRLESNETVQLRGSATAYLYLTNNAAPGASIAAGSAALIITEFKAPL